MNDLLVDFLLTIVAGAIGGFTAHQLALRLFRKQSAFQSKIQDTLKRRDALRDALALSHDAGRGLSFGWKRLGEDDSTTASRLEEMRAQLNLAASLFLDNDKAKKGLFGLRNLIGIDPARWQESGVDPFLALRESQDSLEKALEDIDELLDRL